MIPGVGNIPASLLSALGVFRIGETEASVRCGFFAKKSRPVAREGQRPFRNCSESNRKQPPKECAITAQRKAQLFG